VIGVNTRILKNGQAEKLMSASAEIRLNIRIKILLLTDILIIMLTKSMSSPNTRARVCRGIHNGGYMCYLKSIKSPIREIIISRSVEF
jgi:hypothetical protein